MIQGLIWSKRAVIGRLRGELLEKHPPQLVIDVSGVGYEVDASMNTFYQLPEVGRQVTLYTHMVVREHWRSTLEES